MVGEGRCAVLGLQHDLATDGAHQAATLFARQRDRFGQPIAASGAEMAQIVFDHVVAASVDAVLTAALDEDGLPSAMVAEVVRVSTRR